MDRCYVILTKVILLKNVLLKGMGETVRNVMTQME